MHRRWITLAAIAATSSAFFAAACGSDDTSAPTPDTWPDANVKDAPFVPYDVGPFPDAGPIGPACYFLSADEFNAVSNDLPVDIRHGACTGDDITVLSHVVLRRKRCVHVRVSHRQPSFVRGVRRLQRPRRSSVRAYVGRSLLRRHDRWPLRQYERLSDGVGR